MFLLRSSRMVGKKSVFNMSSGIGYQVRANSSSRSGRMREENSQGLDKWNTTAVSFSTQVPNKADGSSSKGKAATEFQPPNMPKPHVAVVVLLVEPYNPIDKERYLQLQEARKKHDHAFFRWLPHITLIPPFLIPFAKDIEVESNRQPAGRHKGDHDKKEERVENIGQYNTTLLHATLSDLADRIQKVCYRHTKHLLLVDQVNHFKLKTCSNIHLRPSSSCGPYHRHATNVLGHVSQDSEEDTLLIPRVTAQDEIVDQGSAILMELQADLVASLSMMGKDGGRRSRNPTSSSSSSFFPSPSSNNHKTQTQAERKELSPFKPHISVGQAYNNKQKEELFNLARRVITFKNNDSYDTQQPPMDGIVCRVDKIQLMIKPRDREGAYDSWREFPLGSPSDGGKGQG